MTCTKRKSEGQIRRSNTSWISKYLKKCDILVGGNSSNPDRNVGRNDGDTLRKKNMSYTKEYLHVLCGEKMLW